MLRYHRISYNIFATSLILFSSHCSLGQPRVAAGANDNTPLLTNDSDDAARQLWRLSGVLP